MTWREQMAKEKGVRGLKKKRIAWGITGSGDKLVETMEVMKEIKKRFEGQADIRVYLSKAGGHVIKYYGIEKELEENFGRLWTEINPNAPFLAGLLQMGKFEFLLIAPATSNTVAKISTGIADSLLSNAAIMALKAYVPVYIMPSDYREGEVTTILPNGREMKLRIRKEDAEHVKRLENMEDIYVMEKPQEIEKIFEKYYS